MVVSSDGRFQGLDGASEGDLVRWSDVEASLIEQAEAVDAATTRIAELERALRSVATLQRYDVVSGEVVPRAADGLYVRAASVDAIAGVLTAGRGWSPYTRGCTPRHGDLDDLTDYPDHPH